MGGNTIERATTSLSTFPHLRPSRRRSPPPPTSPIAAQKIMAQGQIPASKRIKGITKRIGNIKKKLDHLKILCGTEGFIIYSCSNGLQSFPEGLDSIQPLIERYQTCMKSGLYKGERFPKPLEPSKEATTLELEVANRDHKLARMSLGGCDQNIEPPYTGLKTDDDYEFHLSKILHSISGNYKLDSFSIQELREILHRIDSLARTNQAKLKPLELLGKSSRCIKYGKESGYGENGELQVALSREQNVSFDLLGELSDGIRKNTVKENIVPKTVATRDKDTEGKEKYILGEVSEEKFRFVFTGEQLQSLEVIGKLSNRTEKIKRAEEVVHSRVGKRKSKETDKGYSPLKMGRGKGMKDEPSASMGKGKEKETDKVPHLTTSGDQFRLFFSGDQIQSLELIGKISSKFVNGDKKDDEEPVLTLAL